MSRPWRIALAACIALACVGAARGETGARPGAFDYYILSLSWSPAFCATHADDAQCGPRGQTGFVEHGLWPQYEHGGYPTACGTAPPLPKAVVESMMPVMPGTRLIWHQWAKHGTCSGLDATDYFATAAKAFLRVNLPERLRLRERLGLPAATVRAWFVEANTGLHPDGVAVVCDGDEITEVRLCLTKDLAYRRCGRGVADRCGARRRSNP